jgi:uncharacterized protein with PIN domain
MKDEEERLRHERQEGLQFFPMKECPLCGEIMRLTVREVRDSVPGGGQGTVRVLREWICPECDHFEEAEAGEGNS